MVDQKRKCTQFIDGIDSFLKKFLGRRLHLTVLEEYINNNRMRFVAKIDPATMQEEYRKQSLHARKEEIHARKRGWFANLSEERKEERKKKICA